MEPTDLVLIQMVLQELESVKVPQLATTFNGLQLQSHPLNAPITLT